MRADLLLTLILAEMQNVDVDTMREAPALIFRNRQLAANRSYVSRAPVPAVRRRATRRG